MSTYIADTADVVFRRKSDGHVVFTAEAQLASIAGDSEEEIVRGGIGNLALYTIRHSKSVTLTVRNATFDLEYLAMTQGVAIKDDTALITRVEKDLVVEKDTDDNLFVNIKGIPTDATVTVKNKDGEVEEAAVVGNEVTIPVGHADEGDKVEVIYKEKVTGKGIILDATKFSESYEVEYHTIQYNTETNQVEKDIYFIFNNAVPAGTFELSMENGTALTPELEFNAMADPHTKQIGQIIEVDRN